MQKDDQKYDVFKIVKGMVKTNQGITGQQCLRNGDGELAVSYEDTKIPWESYHEKLLNTVFVCDRNSFLRRYSYHSPSLRPTLKSCSFPIHQPGEIKLSLEPPTGRNFFFLQSLCLKR